MNSDEHPPSNSTAIILAQLKDIATAVMYAAEGGSLEQVLERIAHVSQDLVNVRYAALGVPDGKGGLRYFKVAGMTPESIARLDHLPVGHGLLGAIMEERSTIRLENMTEDERSAGFCHAHPVMTSLLGVPIQVGQRLYGTLYLCDRIDGEPFSELDQWLVETLAGYAALAIAGSQLAEQESRLTLLEERERIGMELHDGIIQSLYAIGMHLDLMRMSDEASEEPDEPMVEVLNSLNGVIEDIRRYIMNLPRGGDHKKTIADWLQEVIDRLRPPETLQIELNAPDSLPLFTPGTFAAIGMMANEAISNAMRHAQATHISVIAHQHDNLFQVTIADDGEGFDPEGLSNHEGLGLRNIKQRAAMYNGRIHIESEPGKGTRLTIIVPVQIRSL